MVQEFSVDQPTIVFVYGSLLQGESNHQHLIHARFIGPARTEPGFELVDLGSYPAMIRSGSSTVEGELYEVDTDTLVLLDLLEGHPHYYERTEVPLAGGASAEAYLMEIGKTEGCPRIPSGNWRTR